MNTPIEFDGEIGKIVYIRPVNADDLPPEVMGQVGDNTQAHAILGENGAVIGLAPNREMAFLLARQHELAPQSVH